MNIKDNLPFCIKNNTTLVQFGTRGDVHTFFLVTFQLIEKGILEDLYPLITTELYRKCIHVENAKKFEVQFKALFARLEKIKTNAVDWDKLPFNRVLDHSPNGRLCYDLNLPNLSEIFEKYLTTFLRHLESYEICIEKGYNFYPMFIAPTDVKLYQKYKRMTPDDFEAQADNPFWMREPFLVGGEENVATLFVDASKK